MASRKPSERPDERREEAPPGTQLGFRAPRTTPVYLEHGTRVSYRFACDRCGADEDLPFAPKTASGKLCRDCAQEVFGPNWARGRRIPPRTSDSHVFKCSTCSHVEERNTDRPAPPNWQCVICRKGIEASKPERVRGGSVVDGGGGVKRLRRGGGNR